MGIIDIFKRKKEPAKKIKPAKKPKETKEKKPIKKAPPAGKAPAKPAKPIKKGKFVEAYRILKMPHVTEKATDLTEKNQYIFRVWPGANKNEIKKAIESLYGVEVVSVKIIKVPAKKRKLGRIEGFRKSYKKAIVKIKEGQKIEVLPR